MAIDFDDEDLDAVLEEVQAPEKHDLRRGPAQSDDAIDEQMTEVEQRLEMAQYYRLLLNDSIFQDPPNPIVASRVETEIRDFIRTRMSLLVGVGTPAATPNFPQFTKEDVERLRELADPLVVKALKELVARLLKKPSILEPRQLKPETPKEPPREPSLRKVGRPPGSVNKVSTPSPQEPQQPKKGKRQEKIYKTVINPDTGEEVRMDITPQARPTGKEQPVPTVTGKANVERQMEAFARQRANVGLQNLSQKLQGKG